MAATRIQARPRADRDCYAIAKPDIPPFYSSTKIESKIRCEGGLEEHRLRDTRSPGSNHKPKIGEPKEANMRVRLVTLSILVMLCVPALAHASTQPIYYLALGDSLAIGVQPSANGDVATKQGYADDLFAVFRTRVRGLRLAKLGCSGETTATMIEGGVCSYGEGSQLAAAVNFLQTHKVGLVTLDIGANDIDHCISLTGIDQTCLTNGLASVGTNLSVILAQLRNAAAPDTRIIAMNYYDPFLAAWTFGPTGQALANASLQVTEGFNNLLDGTYHAFSIPVADVAKVVPYHRLQAGALYQSSSECIFDLDWTWMGAPPPLGPDIHPNAIGYIVIAGAFVEKIAP